MRASFSFGFEGSMLEMILLVPDHCLSLFTLNHRKTKIKHHFLLLHNHSAQKLKCFQFNIKN